MSRESGDIDGWRNKYYDSVERLESKEREWQRVEGVLRQFIVRLTLAADGVDSEMDRALVALREAIRRDRSGSELEGLMERLSAHITRLDQARRDHARAPTPKDTLLALIDGLDLPRGLNRRAKSLRKRIAASGAETPLEEQIKEVAELIGEAIEWVSEEGAAPAEGGKPLLGRIFSGRREKTEPATAGEGEAHKILNRIIRALASSHRYGDEGKRMAGRLRVAEGEAALMGLADDVAGLILDVALPDPLDPHELLIQVIERLSVPAEFEEKAVALKATLGEGSSRLSVGGAVSAVADLIGEMRLRVQNEKEEIENFLKQLTSHLQELDQNFQISIQAQRESYTGGRNLDEAVQQQVQGIEESVQQAVDLDLLKHALQERVGTIRRHLDQFRSEEESRRERAERQVEHLTERLNELESEAEGLRERIRLERCQALMDPLTEISNRLAYDERIKQEYVRWKRYGNPLVMMVWDVDHFKKINDRYGHQAGDKVLRIIAKRLTDQVRESDFVARYGGEEFVVLLPEADPASALAVAEKLRKSIDDLEFHYRDEPVPITISCGIATFRQNDDPESVFRRADAALYRAKEAGRNCCRSETD